MSLMYHAYLCDTVTCKLNSMAVCISFQRTDVHCDSSPHFILVYEGQNQEDRVASPALFASSCTGCVGVRSRVSSLM